MKYTQKKTDRRRGTERTERNREDEVYMKGKEINMQREREIERMNSKEREPTKKYRGKEDTE
jgi:hypothetical protein